MNSKAKYIIYFIVFCSVILVLKSAQLQIFNNKYKEQARRTTLDKVTKYPARGLIFDRNNKLMVANNTIYDIQAIYNNIPEDLDTNSLCELLEIDKETFLRRIEKDWKRVQYSKSTPYTFLSKIKPEQYSKFQEHLHRFAGFYPVERTIRSYPHENAAHVLGFLGEVDRKDIENNSDIYQNGDYIGRSGLERTYEEELRGLKGVSYVMKDNLGREVGSFDNGSLDSSAISGKDMITTIDLDLQAYGEQLMANKIGSVIAIEPRSGEILTMLSSPSYDPNLLNLDRSRGISYDSLSQDTLTKPLFDRSVMAKYPPGSIFKLVFSLVAMQEGTLDPNRTIYCDGTYEVDSKGKYVHKCHQHPTPYNVGIAIQHSCNSYYYQSFREFIDNYGYSTPGRGLDTLRSYLMQFGLGERLGIDYHVEEKGFLPSKEFYDRLYNYVYNGWRSTYILSVGIGQGELQLTTLQMANVAAIIANKGYFFTPHLLKGFDKPDQGLPTEFSQAKTVAIDPPHFDYVIEGMSKVTTVGTGQLARVPGVEICGKTGTSENPHGKDHSVFIAFAPKENPQIAIAVYVENAGFGGDIAAPIAGLMIEKYLKGEISPAKKWVEDRMLKKSMIEPTPALLSLNNTPSQ